MSSIFLLWIGNNLPRSPHLCLLGSRNSLRNKQKIDSKMPCFKQLRKQEKRSTKSPGTRCWFDLSLYRIILHNCTRLPVCLLQLIQTPGAEMPVIRIGTETAVMLLHLAHLVVVTNLLLEVTCCQPPSWHHRFYEVPSFFEQPSVVFSMGLGACERSTRTWCAQKCSHRWLALGWNLQPRWATREAT